MVLMSSGEDLSMSLLGGEERDGFRMYFTCKNDETEG